MVVERGALVSAGWCCWFAGGAWRQDRTTRFEGTVAREEREEELSLLYASGDGDSGTQSSFWMIQCNQSQGRRSRGTRVLSIKLGHLSVTWDGDSLDRLS